MSKIAICYFSYHKDKDFLNNSLRVLENTIKNHAEHEVRVYVFDDGRCDKHLKKKELYGSPTLISTNFDRKGNLNGYDCIDGMFFQYRKIMEKFDYDYLIKLDSDCVLNSFNYINLTETELKKNNIPIENIGQIGSFFAQLCVYGCCQTFSKKGINTIFNLFAAMNRGLTNEERIMKKRVTNGYNEDKVVSVLLEMSPVIRVNIDMIRGLRGHCNAFTYKGNDYGNFTSVAFKPNYFDNRSDWSREKSLEVMTQYVEKFKKT